MDDQTREAIQTIALALKKTEVTLRKIDNRLESQDFKQARIARSLENLVNVMNDIEARLRYMG